jgi:hypothetical protein
VKIEFIDEGIYDPDGLSPAMKSSRHSGIRVTWLRSWPSMNRFMLRTGLAR